MRRVLMAIAVLFGLVACGGPTVQAPTLPADGPVSGGFYTVEVDGHECIVWIDGHDLSWNNGYTNSGLSCDWSAR